MSFDLNKYFNTLQNGNLVTAFKGKVTTEVVNSILQEVENKLIAMDEHPKVIKKVYNVLIEGLQNLFHHTEQYPAELEKELGDKTGIMVIQKNEDHILIVLGNFVEKDQRDYLIDKIEKINASTEDELKGMYMDVLNNQELSAKGGGGLGLIDIAKRTKNKLEYNFFEYKNNWYFYSLNVKVLK